MYPLTEYSGVVPFKMRDAWNTNSISPGESTYISIIKVYSLLPFTFPKK